MRILILSFLLIISASSLATNSLSYPERAQKLRINGEVNVLYDINKAGDTENIRIVSMTPEYVFDREVQKQIGDWRYPAGQPQKDIPLRILFKAN